MAVQTLIGHFITEIRRRTRYRYEAGHVTASVPELPGLESEGSSEEEAREAFLGLYIAWLLKQLNRGLPVPPLGEYDLNTDYNRRLFKRETGLTIPLLTEQPDPDQMWFWTPKWQEMAREAEADITAGRTELFGSDEEFLASLPD